MAPLSSGEHVGLVGPGSAAPLRVLIVDDEPDLAESLAWRLEQVGVDVRVATDGVSALAAVERDQPDLILLDLVLPRTNGFDVLREIQRISPATSVIMVSGHSDEADRVVAFEMGVDDFVVKPFSSRELVARIRARLRLVQSPPEPTQRQRLRFGDLEINVPAHRVFVRGTEIDLTTKEFELLLVLAQSPDQVFNRSELIDLVWLGSKAGNPEASLYEYMGRLRQKLESDPDHPRWLRTTRGKGYSLQS